MTTKGKRPMRALTPGDKIEAIQRVNDGESKASVARDIGVPESTLRGWCKNEDKLRYMTSRLSSPDTDKSNDGEPPDKRARTESPAGPAPPSPAPAALAGLDLTTPPSAPLAPLAPLAPHAQHAPHTAPAPAPPPPVSVDAPVELTTKRAPSSPPQHAPRERRPDPGASVSMSAISPLSGLAHLPGLAHSHMGLSFNEIATNLTLLAQLNPGLSALSAQPTSRALRSVRSPKPAHNGGLGLSESKHRSKSHHSDPYRHAGKASHHAAVAAAAAAQPVDDTLWYWLKTQQAMLDLTAQTTAAHPLQLPKPTDPLPPKPVAPAPPIGSHLDYNRNSWLWQYYKQFGGAMPFPEDKLKSASQVPKEKSAENILYSHLTKGKAEEERTATSPGRPVERGAGRPVEESHEPAPPTSPGAPAVPAAPPAPNALDAPDADSGTGTDSKEPSAERHDAARSQTKARTVLDNLLFNGASHEEARAGDAAAHAWEAGAAEALEHGDKFLSWLEASGDPSVTRMHVHQLRALMHNLRVRRAAPAPPPAHPAPAEHAARRK